MRWEEEERRNCHEAAIANCCFRAIHFYFNFPPSLPFHFLVLVKGRERERDTKRHRQQHSPITEQLDTHFTPSLYTIFFSFLLVLFIIHSSWNDSSTLTMPFSGFYFVFFFFFLLLLLHHSHCSLVRSVIQVLFSFSFSKIFLFFFLFFFSVFLLQNFNQFLFSI